MFRLLASLPGTGVGKLEVMRVRSVRDPAGSRAGVRWGVVVLALLLCNCAHAETRVYLLRGWFGVFSTGMDSMAEELRGKGIKAEAIGHTSWKSMVSKVVKERAAGTTDRLVLVGHSQGANNVIEMARELETHKVPVDLLITLAPFMQDPVPSNVVRALNYYQSPGWGAPLTADRGFKGELSNIDIGSEVGIFHINIDKSAKVQAEVVGAITALPP
jgi:alpha-beta hydrolase superfamily lysophospholipase